MDTKAMKLAFMDRETADAEDAGWKAGYGFYAACLRPEEKKTNPYKVGTNLFNLWQYGFENGYQERTMERSE